MDGARAIAEIKTMAMIDEVPIYFGSGRMEEETKNESEVLPWTETVARSQK